MKLKEPRRAPVGGWWYRYTIHRFKNDFPATVYGESLNKLIENVTKDMRSNGVDVPADLAQIVEDQICERQPADRCWSGAGDHVAIAIHTAARAVDKVFKTNLESRAKGCSSCRQRRQALNNLFNK
jgi:hypothetical protein